MRRSVAFAVLALAALGSVGVVGAALFGAFSSSLGEYGAIFVVDSGGGGLRRLTQDHRWHEYTWSPDGRWIAATTRSVSQHGIDVPGPVEFVETSSGHVHVVHLSGFASDPAWRSSGSIDVLLTGSRGKVEATRITQVGLAGRVKVGAWIGSVGAAAWSPDGLALAIVSCSHTHPRIRVDLLAPSGRPVRHMGSLSGALPEGTCSDPAAGGELLWAPDGRTLYLPLSTGLWRLSRDGARPRRILAKQPEEPAISPDGRQLVVGLERTVNGDTGELLYLLSAEGGPLRLLTSAFASAPAWSPDGQRVAFVPRAREEIRTIPSVGGKTAVMTGFPASKTEVCCLSWSPKGNRLAFNASAKRPES